VSKRPLGKTSRSCWSIVFHSPNRKRKRTAKGEIEKELWGKGDQGVEGGLETAKGTQRDPEEELSKRNLKRGKKKKTRGRNVKKS